MPRQSAGLLPYRRIEGTLEVLLVHPGGPYWAKRDLGSWSIPKGELLPGDDPGETATREFEEETGFRAQGELVPLTPRRQPGGKLIHAWATQGNWDPALLRSNSFAMEWPPRSGRSQEFPEIDRAEWFRLPEARRKILPGQLPFLEELAVKISRSDTGS